MGLQINRPFCVYIHRHTPLRGRGMKAKCGVEPLISHTHKKTNKKKKTTGLPKQALPPLLTTTDSLSQSAQDGLSASFCSWFLVPALSCSKQVGNWQERTCCGPWCPPPHLLVFLNPLCAWHPVAKEPALICPWAEGDTSLYEPEFFAFPTFKFIGVSQAHQGLHSLSRRKGGAGASLNRHLCDLP